MAEKLTGTLHRIRFHNPENGYTIMIVEDDSHMQHTVVCNMVSPTTGAKFRFEGKIKTHPKFGKQLNADKADPIMPVDTDSIRIYLASGPIRGVGPQLANRIVDKFGEDTFAIIENHPERLMEVSGIERGKLSSIVTSWKEHQASHEVMAFLRSHGVGPARATAIYKKYQDKTIDMIKANPYRLSYDIDGIGFEIADKIAATLSISGNHPDRVMSGLRYMLVEALNAGDCGLHRSELIRRSSRLLGVTRSDVQDGLDQLLASKVIVEEEISGKQTVYLKWMREMEVGVAKRLHRLSGPAVLKVASIEEMDSRDIRLSTSQKAAQDIVVNNKVSVVTGGPGVGKTTILKASLDGIMYKNRGMKVLLAAPTGRAAQRMQASTGLEASTLHRLLGYNGDAFAFHAGNKLDADLVVIDEISMVDLQLMNALLEAMPNHATLVMVGDKDQLPSVGAGSVLRDMINSGAIPTARLTEIHRQSADSGIIINAHAINNGKRPKHSGDFNVFMHKESDTMRDHILHLMVEELPEMTGIRPQDVQILTPSHKGVLGTVAMNAAVQEALNPNPPKSIERMGVKYGVGDKVIQTKNNYDLNIFNGDVGWIVDINMEKKTVSVEFDRGVVEIEQSDMNNLSLAWAITVHKSQGSEYPAVIIPVAGEHFIMHQRNLLYTGVTRGKKQVALVAENRALHKAVTNNPQPKRVSGLMERICNEFGIEQPDLEAEQEDPNIIVGQDTLMGRALMV